MEIVGENKKIVDRKKVKESQWRGVRKIEERGRWEEEKIFRLRVGGNGNWRK